MIAIKTNNAGLVTWIHYDASQLPDTNGVILVDRLPEPDSDPMQISELYYTEAKGFWYKYSPVVSDMEMQDEAPDYETLVNQYIRERYSVSDELAILRQRDSKPEEFSRYYEYAESCKMRAKMYST